MKQKLPVFDWSTLDRKTLSQNILGLKPYIIDKNLSVSEIHKFLSKTIKSNYPVIVSKNYSSEVEQGLIYIGGVYYSDKDQEKQKCIEIQLVYNNPKDKITIDSKRLKRMGVCFADTFLHEIIHMRQFRRRKFKYLPDYASNAEKREQRQEQSYLGSSDEIDAYGFNIACEMNEKFKGDVGNIVRYLDSKTRKRRHSCWVMYLKAFDYDHNHKIIKRLKKKIIRYLPNAAFGKPYKNKDWIDR